VPVAATECCSDMVQSKERKYTMLAKTCFNSGESCIFVGSTPPVTSTTDEEECSCLIFRRALLVRLRVGLVGASRLLDGAALLILLLPALVVLVAVALEITSRME
jgi:hypothetical protein